MSGNFEVVDREVITTAINGVNYGPALWLLARTPTRLLAWRPGFMVYSGIGRTSYAEPCLYLIDRDPHARRDSWRLCSGGRLKRQLFTDQAEAIDGHLGEGFHKLLEPRKTLVFGYD